jgi:hypothetical protein
MRIVGKAYLTVYRLLRALFIFLSDLLTTQRRRQDGICPRVLADGLLRVREAEFDSGRNDTSVVTNQKYEWSSTKLNNAMDNVVSQLSDVVLHKVTTDRHDDWRRLWENYFYSTSAKVLNTHVIFPYKR